MKSAGKRAIWMPRTMDQPRSSSADFNNTNSVNAADYVLWRNAVGSDAEGDANGDGVSDQLDYGLWRQQFGQNLAAGESWETLIDTNKQLLEFFLLGNSTFASRSIGNSYNTAIDARDLTFKYSVAGGSRVCRLSALCFRRRSGVVRFARARNLGDVRIGDDADFLDEDESIWDALRLTGVDLIWRGSARMARHVFRTHSPAISTTWFRMASHG